MEVVIIVVVVGIVAYVGFNIHAKKKRRAYLLEKYKDALIVEQIIDRKVWQGMSREQLIDSWGKPIEVGQRLYKTKLVETCKYNQTGKNRFASRVTVENGFVTGWQKK